MEWKGKEDFEKIINDLNNKILDKNLSKITDPQVNTVVVMFPYNQKSLFVPDDKDWKKILKDTKENVIIIAFPNGLEKAKPNLPDSRLVITVNEMILNYWKEIHLYLLLSPNIKTLKIVTADIDEERVRRDYNLVFRHSNDISKVYNVSYPKVSYLTGIVPNSFWKKIYQIREKLVLSLPICLYEALGKFR